MPNRKPPEGMELKVFSGEFKQAEGEPDGTGSAVISKIGKLDSFRDRIEKGAFDGSKAVHLLPNHSWFSDSPPIGEIRVKENGTDVVGDLKLNLNTTLGKEWHEHLKATSVNQEFSIGFTTEKYEIENKKGEPPVRVIKKLNLHEVSMVIAGAMEGTELLEVRNRQIAKATKKEAPEVDLSNIVTQLDKWLDAETSRLLEQAKEANDATD